LVAKGAGVVRMEAFDLEQKKAPAGPVTVKSKIEQAVFYGAKEDVSFYIVYSGADF
jgi:nuclear pore complex protein Nup133